MVRAKFRVLEINQYFQGQPASQSVFMRPVMAKSASYPDASEENAHFWESTPSGEARVSMTFEGDEFEGGKCYYIDMEPDPEGEWTLNQLNQSGQLEVKFGTNEWSTDICMSISNKTAWPLFVEAGYGSKWKVTFTKAPDTGEGEPY